MKTRTMVIGALLGILLLGFHANVFSQEKGYPREAVQIICSSGPGGGPDTFFRLLSEALRKVWKVPVNVVNQPGAGGMTAASEVSGARKDGYTVFGGLTSQLASVTSAKPKGVNVDVLRDYDPLGVFVGYGISLLCVKSDSKFRTLNDLVKYAKEKPGDVIYGTMQPGGPGYLELRLLLREANIKMEGIPFKTPAENVTALLGGHVDVTTVLDNLIKPHILAGKVRPLVAQRKSLVFPEVPTYPDLGFPKVNIYASLAVLGPKGLPPAVAKAWEDALKLVAADASVVDAYRKNGIPLNLLVGPGQMSTFWKEEIEKYSRFSLEELGWQ
jgi:tripartite-type tricarboxylate transporter receptor subunit TctC